MPARDTLSIASFRSRNGCVIAQSINFDQLMDSLSQRMLSNSNGHKVVLQNTRANLVQKCGVYLPSCLLPIIRKNRLILDGLAKRMSHSPGATIGADVIDTAHLLPPYRLALHGKAFVTVTKHGAMAGMRRPRSVQWWTQTAGSPSAIGCLV